jgi:hypothetical protein
MVPGLPNFFMVYGPQAPTSLANGPPFVEMERVQRVLTYSDDMVAPRLSRLLGWLNRLKFLLSHLLLG